MTDPRASTALRHLSLDAAPASRLAWSVALARSEWTGPAPGRRGRRPSAPAPLSARVVDGVLVLATSRARPSGRHRPARPSLRAGLAAPTCPRGGRRPVRGRRGRGRRRRPRHRRRAAACGRSGRERPPPSSQRGARRSPRPRCRSRRPHRRRRTSRPTHRGRLGRRDRRHVHTGDGPDLPVLLEPDHSAARRPPPGRAHHHRPGRRRPGRRGAGPDPATPTAAVGPRRETCVAALRALCARAVAAGHLATDPAAALTKPRRARSRRRALDRP